MARVSARLPTEMPAPARWLRTKGVVSWIDLLAYSAQCRTAVKNSLCGKASQRFARRVSASPKLLSFNRYARSHGFCRRRHFNPARAYLLLAVSARTAYAVAASLMKGPAREAKSRSLFSEEADQRPLVLSWFCTSQAKPRFTCACSREIPDCCSK